MSDQNSVSQRKYVIELRIKGKDYSRDLRNVRIGSSLANAYPNIMLELLIDPNDIITEEIFGQDPIELLIAQVDSDGKLAKGAGFTEAVEMDLMFVDSKFKLPVTRSILSSKNDAGQVDRVSFIIITVPREAFTTMNSKVNGSAKDISIKDVIPLLVQNANELNLDLDDINNEEQSQIVIPSMTLYNAILGLDRIFNIFSGTTAVYCDHENTLHVLNLTKRISKSKFILRQLSTDIDQSILITNAGDGKEYFTYNALKTNYVGNSRLAIAANNVRYIVKQDDDYYYFNDSVLSDDIKKYGLVDGNDDSFMSDAISSRERAIMEESGESKTGSFDPKAEIIKSYADLASIETNIAYNLPILPLLQVGSPLDLKPKTDEYIKFSGKYILFSSDLQFKKLMDWESMATIKLIRTNRKKS